MFRLHHILKLKQVKENTRGVGIGAKSLIDVKINIRTLSVERKSYGYMLMVTASKRR